MKSRSETIEEDPAETVRWRLLLSGLNGADALLVRGFLLENGVFVNRELAAAADNYRQAATRGHPQGQYRLGLMYARGAGVERDEVEAWAWFMVAAAGGVAEAGEEISVLRTKLTAVQVDAAQARARAVAANLTKK